MREAIMSNRRRSRPICLCLLSFALQAITPDAHDLASAMLPRLLSALASREAATAVLVSVGSNDLEPESAPLGGGSLPSGADDQSRQPDEVCLPGARQASMIVIRLGAGSDRWSLFSHGSEQALPHAGRRSPFPPRFVGRNSSARLVLLGRLIC
jgi:hypothetical protein